MKNFILFLSVLFLSSACNKDDIESYEYNITGGSQKSWTIKSLVHNGETQELSDCETSNKFIFVVDYTYNTDQIDADCSIVGESGIWAIREDTLLIDGLKYKIDLLTPKKLEYSDFQNESSVSFKRFN